MKITVVIMTPLHPSLVGEWADAVVVAMKKKVKAGVDEERNRRRRSSSKNGFNVKNAKNGAVSHVKFLRRIYLTNGFAV
jgi:hypothetical protein